MPRTKAGKKGSNGPSKQAANGATHTGTIGEMVTALGESGAPCAGNAAQIAQGMAFAGQETGAKGSFAEETGAETEEAQGSPAGLNSAPIGQHSAGQPNPPSAKLALCDGGGPPAGAGVAVAAAIVAAATTAKPKRYGRKLATLGHVDKALRVHCRRVETAIKDGLNTPGMHTALSNTLRTLANLKIQMHVLSLDSESDQLEARNAMRDAHVA